MRFILFFAVLVALQLLSSCDEQTNSDLTTPFEISDSVATATYDEAIAWWRKFEKASPYVSMQEFGTTDIGQPLHLVVISPDRNFSNHYNTSHDKTILLINNAIHPGEPDGVDASMLYARELLQSESFPREFRDIVILIIPFYNVGGALNRNCCSRANQDGPESYGFRGNARNLDLNRDFTKADSRNAQNFLKLFQAWDVDVYLETHVSNGADYPYTMTYLLSHPGKLTPPIDETMKNVIENGLVQGMIARNDEMTPYVNVFGTSPDDGFQSFYDSPRYSTGFTALHHSFGLLTETHMLKPFKQRVMSTLRFMHTLGEVVSTNAAKIEDARDAAIKTMGSQKEYITGWRIDTNEFTPLQFKGYRAYYDTSTVTNLPQLYYDRSAPWEKSIPYYDRLVPTQRVTIPEYYLVPRAWNEVIDRLNWNGVEMELLDKDTALSCTVYSIANYETSTQPFEGHYYHSNTVVDTMKRTISIRKNEYYQVDLNQKARRFLVEVLEPSSPDAYFNWNFFDEILQQKEWFSSYVFDKEAEDMLHDSTERAALNAFVATNPQYKDNAFAKLYFLYRQSKHYERDRHMIYPVFRIEGAD